MAQDNRNFFQRLFGTNSIQTKQESMMGYFGIPSNKVRDYDYHDLADEGYLQNAIVYRCVNEISKGASAVAIQVFAGDDLLERHPLLDLLNRPNPLQSRSEFISALSGYLLLSGNCYILKTGNAGPPQELHFLRPDRVEINSSRNKTIPDSYDYKVNGKVSASYPIDPETGKSDVKQLKLWNPLDDYYGASPLFAAAVEVDQHNLASNHNINLLSNGARPSGAVVFKPKDDQGFSVSLSESQRQQLLTDLNNRFQGSHNAGRPLLLEGDFDWKEMSLSPKDMDFLNLKHMAATDIALCFGVPSQLVGVPDAQTYANVAEARLALYEETIIPHLRQIESDFNEWLTPMYGEGLEMRFDIDSIPALAERKRKTYENMVSAVNMGILSRNEAREELGRSPVDGGDDLYISAALIPIGDTDVEEPENPLDPDEVGDLEEMRPEQEDEEEDTVEEEMYDDMDDWFEEAIKAMADLDLTPTDSMKNEAQRGLDWRKEYGRGGTQVGLARANQLIRKERLSPDTVLRMYSFFSRHEVDKEGQGFKPSQDGYPSNGRIAWALWGGDAGFSWSTRKRNQIMTERDKKYEEKAPRITGKVREGLKNKVSKHNEKYGDSKTKRVTLRMLEAVFRRGVGAYNTNRSSVRPSVIAQGGSDRWAYARVNSFLSALRTGRFRGGKHDTDLFPKGHPLSSK
tara:strand:- start:14875 stop:16929 length:2055 start_codon:yes stop_codon:yes gene_type:complete